MKSQFTHSAQPQRLNPLSAMRDVPAVVGHAEEEARRRQRIAAHIVATREKLEHAGHTRRTLGLWMLAALSLSGWLLVWLWPQQQSTVAVRAPSFTLPVASSAAVMGQLLSAETNAALADVRGRPTLPPLGLELPPGLELLSGELLSGAANTADANPVETWTATERTRVRFESDVELELAPDTRVQLGTSEPDASSEELVVLQGQVRVLSKSSDRAAVRIQTKTVRVDALAARFSVSFIADDTRVEVDSGSVRVQHPGGSRTLSAGDHWHQQVDAVSPADATKSVTMNETAVAPAEQASLTEQNRMFETAALAKQRGLYSLALNRLDQLLVAYPAGALSENARVERFRILQRMGQTDGAGDAARAYLSAHPTGFAAAEARRLLVSQP